MEGPFQAFKMLFWTTGAATSWRTKFWAVIRAIKAVCLENKGLYVLMPNSIKPSNCFGIQSFCRSFTWLTPTMTIMRMAITTKTITQTMYISDIEHEYKHNHNKPQPQPQPSATRQIKRLCHCILNHHPRHEWVLTVCKTLQLRKKCNFTSFLGPFNHFGHNAGCVILLASCNIQW